ncbi:unnamed protein product [Lactuca saligna]|uniref:Uncharacterized protein n=1 Tax=Lactuca saligna TaxID=75948 RepID=A0AA35Z850_LACSI|nr:unnamed protein product [Lactuca saligna]
MESRLHKAGEDMYWVLSCGIAKFVDKLIAESSFFYANRDLQSICVDFGKRTGCEMMNTEHNLGLSKTEIPLYDPTRAQKMEESFSTLFCGDYLVEFGFTLSNIERLCALVGPTNNRVSICHGGGAGVGGS